jgi:rfaE bifunctional protein kinase chain/domain
MEDLLERFNGLKALVVGDVMIDAYTKGVVERMSPEAPVPIVSQCDHFERLGGAANVALNLKALGAEPVICSIVGNDEAGRTFLKLMQEQGLEVAGVVSSNARRTTVKHRVLNGDRQLLRIDEEDTFDLTETEHSILAFVLRRFLEQKSVDVVLLQDYNKGVLTEKLIREVISLCQERSLPVVVDPKKKNFFAYQGVTLFKPNAKELREGLGVTAETPEELQQAMLTLQQRIHCEYLMVTLSDKGVMMLHEVVFHHLPAHPRNIVDVSGAGDTVLSVAALCVALKAAPESIASLSNIAGGLVCEEVGVVPIDKGKFAEEVNRICHG